MEWTAAVDAYCERTDPSYWSEPVNAITNASFLIAALIMARRVQGAGLPWAWVLVGLLAAIGVGSYLFHTHATGWAGAADVAPIVLFILAYVYVANRFYFGWSWWVAGLGTLAFLPYAVVLSPVIAQVPFLQISGPYWTVALLIAIYAYLLRNRLPSAARGLAIGAAILTLSLTFRSLDMPACEAFPLGTHFMWHILNGIMLGWMIEVYRRHMLAGVRAPG